VKEEDLKRVVKEAIAEAFTAFGFTANDPVSMQQDMSHLRKWRLSCDAIKNNIARFILWTGIPGLLASLYMVWDMVKQGLKGN
jgi:hypothetical protein